MHSFLPRCRCQSEPCLFVDRIFFLCVRFLQCNASYSAFVMSNSLNVFFNCLCRGKLAQETFSNLLHHLLSRQLLRISEIIFPPTCIGQNCHETVILSEKKQESILIWQSDVLVKFPPFCCLSGVLYSLLNVKRLLEKLQKVNSL